MKRFFASTVFVAGLLLVLGQGNGLAGMGGPGPHGDMDGGGPIHELVDFDCTGSVLGYMPQEGMLLAPDGSESNSETCDQASEVILGIGSVAYWDELGYERPAKDDEVQILGYTWIDNLSGEEDNVACKVVLLLSTVPTTVTLRDCPEF